MLLVVYVTYMLLIHMVMCALIFGYVVHVFEANFLKSTDILLLIKYSLLSRHHAVYLSIGDLIHILFGRVNYIQNIVFYEHLKIGGSHINYVQNAGIFVFVNI